MTKENPCCGQTAHKIESKNANYILSSKLFPMTVIPIKVLTSQPMHVMCVNYQAWLEVECDLQFF